MLFTGLKVLLQIIDCNFAIASFGSWQCSTLHFHLINLPYMQLGLANIW